VNSLWDEFALSEGTSKLMLYGTASPPKSLTVVAVNGRENTDPSWHKCVVVVAVPGRENLDSWLSFQYCADVPSRSSNSTRVGVEPGFEICSNGIAKYFSSEC